MFEEEGTFSLYQLKTIKMNCVIEGATWMK